MTADGKIRVAVVGLEFGQGFLPGFIHHPNVEYVGVCDINERTLRQVGDRFGVSRRHADLRQILDSKAYDAVALFTPIPDHAWQVIDVMNSGKHCACAVPMATTIEDLRAIIATRRRTGRCYMMMETSLYTPEFLFVQDMHRTGEFGRLQFLRGVWHNNLENHPRYWHGLPPMHYITHPISPILALAGTPARRVCCFGSGTMRPEFHEVYGNTYPIETAIFKLHNSDLAVEITSITIETALQNKETFDLWGSKQSFTWATFHDDRHALIRIHPARPGGPKSSPNTVFRFGAPSADDRLPRELWWASPRQPQPHLCHEFVMSILERRESSIDVVQAANYTAPGLCAHESASKGGEPVQVPAFDE